MYRAVGGMFKVRGCFDFGIVFLVHLNLWNFGAPGQDS
jgi:hypothetical protein